MRRRPVILLWGVLLGIIAASGVWAGAAGVFTQVEGKVELLRQGRAPAVPVRAQEAVAPGDAVRTGADARAQIRFMDDSVLTIAPGSLVTIEAFHYDREAGVRKAVLQVLRGLVHCAVEKIFKVERPDFLLKTHTAVLGVRGTRWYTLLGARYTAVYGEGGTLEVGSLFPEITRTVLVRGGEMSSVALKELPAAPRRYPPAMREVLKFWLRKGVPAWVLSLDPGQLLLLEQAPPKPELQQLPESLFVPPVPKAIKPPEPPGPEPPGPGPGPIEPGGPNQPIFRPDLPIDQPVPGPR